MQQNNFFIIYTIVASDVILFDINSKLTLENKITKKFRKIQSHAIIKIASRKFIFDKGINRIIYSYKDKKGKRDDLRNRDTF